MSAALRDRHGDIWTLGPDGLMHTPETAPFPREHVEHKWGPLVEVGTEPTCQTCGIPVVALDPEDVGPFDCVDCAEAWGAL